MIRRDPRGVGDAGVTTVKIKSSENASGYFAILPVEKMLAMRHLNTFSGFALLASSILFISISASARAQKTLSAENILDLHKVNDVQLSPDGKQAAIVLN